jgi:hypothetical protein
MNKKMSDLRMQYINKISQVDRNKKEGREDAIISRVLLQEK